MKRRWKGGKGKKRVGLVGWAIFANGFCDGMTAIQRIPVRLQRYGGAVRAHGEFEDADESGE